MKTFLSSKVVKKPRLSEIMSKKPKPQKKKSETWCVVKILEFAADDLISLLKYCHISKSVRDAVNSHRVLWANSIPRSLKWPLKAKITAIDSSSADPRLFKERLLKLIKEESAVRLSNKANSLQKIFGYNTMKENVVTQIIENFDIKINIYVNDSLAKSSKSMIKKDNYSSYFFSVYDMQKFKFYDTINLRIEVCSMNSNIKFEDRLVLSEQEVTNSSSGLKVYAFHMIKNLLFVNFKGDNKIMFMFFKISMMEIIHKFASLMNKKLEVFKVKSVKNVKSLPVTSVNDYLANKTDFEFIVSFYNCKSRAFYYINTRMMPKVNTKKNEDIEGDIKRHPRQYRTQRKGLYIVL
jgi:hypothetical protein